MAASLAEEIHAQMPPWRRLWDDLRGGALSRAEAASVGEARLIEHDANAEVARRGWELQAALEARAESLGAPPPLLEQDIDSLAHAAAGLSLGEKPHSAADPAGYARWVAERREPTARTAALLVAARRHVALGEWDGLLVAGLGPDELVEALKPRRSAGSPELSELESATSLDGGDGPSPPGPEL